MAHSTVSSSPGASPGSPAAPPAGPSPHPPTGSRLLRRLTTLALRRPRRVLLATLALAGIAALLGAGVANRLDPYEAAGADTPSATAAKTVERATGLEPGAGVLVLVDAPNGVYAHATRARVQGIERTIHSDPEVGRVQSYLDTGNSGAQRALLVSRDARMTYLTVQFRAGSPKEHQDAAQHLSTRLEHLPGVSLGGPDLGFVWGNHTVQSDLRRAQLIALPILLVLLLLFFRGVVAGLLPLILGGLSILLCGSRCA